MPMSYIWHMKWEMENVKIWFMIQISITNPFNNDLIHDILRFLRIYFD